MARGWEGSPQDEREDKANARKLGMTQREYEKSAADRRHDAGRAKGGKVKFGGKQAPPFGKGKGKSKGGRRG